MVRGGREEEECYESIRDESPIPTPKKSISKERLPLRNSYTAPAERSLSVDRISPSLSSDRQSNSLYGANELNDLDSDDWEDISETEQVKPTKRAGPAVVMYVLSFKIVTYIYFNTFNLIYSKNQKFKIFFDKKIIRLKYIR